MDSHGAQTDRFGCMPAPHTASIGDDYLVSCLLIDRAEPDASRIGADDAFLADHIRQCRRSLRCLLSRARKHCSDLLQFAVGEIVNVHIVSL
ncbi:hypothetical protein D9M73_268440 [compost metagenome]